MDKFGNSGSEVQPYSILDQYTNLVVVTMISGLLLRLHLIFFTLKLSTLLTGSFQKSLHWSVMPNNLQPHDFGNFWTFSMLSLKL